MFGLLYFYISQYDIHTFIMFNNYLCSYQIYAGRERIKSILWDKLMKYFEFLVFLKNVINFRIRVIFINIF